MMKNAVVGIQADHHDLIHQYGFQNHPPEEVRAQYTLFFNDQEPDEKADKGAEIVQKHKVNVLGPAAYSSFVHDSTSFPL
jgi:hypothetical protein